jgi:hypothetical protein
MLINYPRKEGKPNFALGRWRNWGTIQGEKARIRQSGAARQLKGLKKQTRIKAKGGAR